MSQIFLYLHAGARSGINGDGAGNVKHAAKMRAWKNFTREHTPQMAGARRAQLLPAQPGAVSSAAHRCARRRIRAARTKICDSSYSDGTMIEPIKLS